MAFSIRMGRPDMLAFWQDLLARHAQGALDKDEAKLFRQLAKALGHLGVNPRHPGLASHEIDELSRRCGLKVFESYLENDTPAAGRLFWAYGPDRGDITVLGIEPHPDDRKHGAYQRVRLSAMPPPQEHLAGGD